LCQHNEPEAYFSSSTGGVACGARSVQIKTIRLFLESNEEVLQPCLVSTVCSTAQSWWDCFP
jgi:hypothetical protein